jgi:hypothetical protein
MGVRRSACVSCDVLAGLHAVVMHKKAQTVSSRQQTQQECVRLEEIKLVGTHAACVRRGRGRDPLEPAKREYVWTYLDEFLKIMTSFFTREFVKVLR